MSLTLHRSLFLSCCLELAKINCYHIARLNRHSTPHSVQCFTHRYFKNLVSNQRIQSRYLKHSVRSSGNIKPLQSVLSVRSNPMSTFNSSKNERILREKFKPRDCEFKTPYGHIAGLEWGCSDAPHKVLAIHGWLDNAGSFERIVPFILDHGDNANKYHIIAIDMPGVGLSSHMPPSAIYSIFSVVIEMRRVLLKMKWEKVTLLAHSLGSHLSFLYSCIYPNQVETLISIDLAHPVTRVLHNWNITIANSIEDHLKNEYQHQDDHTNNILVPIYSEEEAIKRLMDGHANSLNRESAIVMMKRGSRKERWGYTFSRDIRWRYLSPEFRPDDTAMLKYLDEAFKPNLLVIRASKSIYHRPEQVRLQYYELYEKKCPMLRDVIIDGTHHLHMNSPEPVAVHINKFLDDVNSRERVGVIINKSNL